MGRTRGRKSQSIAKKLKGRSEKVKRMGQQRTGNLYRSFIKKKTES